MNFYDQLGVEQTASGQEIKRAYFRMVRKFTPEKDPEAFMRLRKAYETLSDEARRAAYNASLSRFSNMPEEVTSLVMESERLALNGLHTDAVRLLEQSEHSSHNDTQCALCRLYLDMDKSGKAAKIIEKLVANNPNNIEYMRLAAKAYMARSWTNKAYDMQKNLRRIDPGSEENSIALLFGEDHMSLFHMGFDVETCEKNERKAPLLCAMIMSEILWRDHSDMNYVAEQLSFFLSENKTKSQWDNPVFAAKKLAEHTKDISVRKRESVRDFLKDTLKGMFRNDRYAALPHIDQTIRNIGADEMFLSAGYEVVFAGYLTLKAVEEGIPKTVAALSLMHTWAQSDILEADRNEYQNEILVLEMEILGAAHKLAPCIRRFKHDFTPQYNRAADFFEMVSQAGIHKIESELRRRIPRAMKINTRLTLEWLGKDETTGFDGDSEERQEPVRVAKVGRNELCPCGSGKKYKKCCGGY